MPAGTTEDDHTLHCGTGPPLRGRSGPGYGGPQAATRAALGRGAVTSPSRHAVRCDHTMVTAMAAIVMPKPDTCLTTRKVVRGRLSSSTKATVAKARLTPAQRIVRPRNSDTTSGFAAISGVMGQ